MSETEFFKEVEFEMPPSPGLNPPKEVVTWDAEILKESMESIEAEIEKIKNGTSKHVTYAINPGKFPFPALNAMRIFVADPSDKTFQGIHDICRQDFGSRAGDLFYLALRSARKVVKNG